MIYRKLVLPERADPHRKSCEIETAILRVNKQMHREASGILQRETNWVTVSRDDGEAGELAIERSCSGHPGFEMVEKRYMVPSVSTPRYRIAQNIWR